MVRERTERCAVHAAANFERNLEAIRRFLAAADASGTFEGLLDALFDQVVPNLARLPELGRDFLARTPGSVEALTRLERIAARLGPGVGVREYIHGDYLILYALKARDVYLLAIKHHRQLSFDLPAQWR